MKFKVLGLALMALPVFAIPAVAHHSFAMFDAGKTMTLEGSVKEFRWTNPHSWVFLTVTNANGQPEEWPIELGAPSGLIRQGWGGGAKTLTAGMKVKVVIRPLKDGKIGGQFLLLTLPDGKQLGDPSTAGPASSQP